MSAPTDVPEYMGHPAEYWVKGLPGYFDEEWPPDARDALGALGALGAKAVSALVEALGDWDEDSRSCRCTARNAALALSAVSTGADEVPTNGTAQLQGGGRRAATALVDRVLRLPGELRDAPSTRPLGESARR